MKKAFCLIALAAISFSSVIAGPLASAKHAGITVQTDTTMKTKTHKMKKKKSKKDTSTMKKDSTKM